MVKDIYSGTDAWGDAASGYPSNLTVYNGSLYFSAMDASGMELWKTDGTESGTVMVMDIYAGRMATGRQLLAIRPT